MTDLDVTSDYQIRLPDAAEAKVDQDAEWCVLETPEGPPRRVRFHDYDEIFQVPGLYEKLFYETLECTSPVVMRELVADGLKVAGIAPGELRVLDVGAGNGMVGEELEKLGTDRLVGADIIAEARDATERDRPGIYDDYLVVDLTAPTPTEDRTLSEGRFNVMTCVAALGFGDIPVAAFERAFSYVVDGGLIAFNLKDRFLEDDDPSGFNVLIRALLEDGTLDVIERRRYQHRLSAAGEPIHYEAFVARKTGGVSDAAHAEAVQAEAA